MNSEPTFPRRQNNRKSVKITGFRRSFAVPSLFFTIFHALFSDFDENVRAMHRSKMTKQRAFAVIPDFLPKLKPFLPLHHCFLPYFSRFHTPFKQKPRTAHRFLHRRATAIPIFFIFILQFRAHCAIIVHGMRTHLNSGSRTNSLRYAHTLAAYDMRNGQSGRSRSSIAAIRA